MSDTTVESLVRHMCQIASENGPVAARDKIDPLLDNLIAKLEAAFDFEREAACSAERERCARIADARARRSYNSIDEHACRAIAAAIRAGERGDE